jgi:hypothetical protein
MVRRRRAGANGSLRRRNEGAHVIRHWLRNPLLWSPVAALALQALLAGIAAASTGGGDFPIWRR